jgi:hypothetical protein
MNNTNTGGPAFPAYEFIPSYKQMMAVGGMTLRDYFAAKVLQGLLASGLDQPKFEFARKSYEMADEMLKAREV